MSDSSQIKHPFAPLSTLMGKICKSLEVIVGDFDTETQFPRDPNDLAEALGLLGQACLIAHEIADRNESASPEILTGLHQVARVMGTFENDMDNTNLENAVEVLLHMLEESAMSLDALNGNFKEYLNQFKDDDTYSRIEIQQALALRREVEFARVALVEMGLNDDIPDLEERIRNFDGYFSVVIKPLNVGIKKEPGLRIRDNEWWVYPQPADTEL